MTVLTRPDLDRSLREGRVSPLYLLHGPESFLRDAAADAIADAALSDTLLREFNHTSFDLLSQSAGAAIAAAEQLPMMSSRRSVKVYNFGRLREADEEILIRYLERPAPSSVLIFVVAELDKRKKLTKSLLDTCLVVEFQPLRDGEAKLWVKTKLKELKISADEQALSELITLAGTDVQTLSSELEKLASAAAASRRITLEMVEALIGRTRELSNFELGDLIVSRNRKRALETLHRLLEGGSPPVMLIGLIANNYHRLALAKELLQKGSSDDVFRVVNLPSFKRKEFLDTLRRTDAGRISQAIQLIAAADLAIKTSQGTPRMQLEFLVCELAS
jgi:DNA polymerase-3 subunit delta